MNELQKIEFDILRECIRIMDAHDLRYYLVCGSALGAVKYGGFIPWDDDMDIGLFREDYERFCEIAPRELPEYYFLQNYQTDPAFPAIFSKVRDSRTTYIEKSASELEICHGVYIDVFPLDGYPESKSEARRLERKKKLYTLSLASAFCISESYSAKAKLFFKAERALGLHKRTAKTVASYEKLIAKYPTDSSRLICNHGNWQGRLEYAPREQYGNGAWASFEGLPVRIPERFDEYLTQKYGDWRADLPEEKKVGHHYYEILDLSRPYTEYVKK